MGRESRPYFKATHKAWYATIHGKKHRLGTDKKEADREFHRLMVLGGRAQGSTLTVDELVKLFLADCQGRVKATTAEIYGVWLARWSQHAGGMRAASLKPFMVMSWLKQHPAWGGNTRSLAITILKIWARWCKRSGYLDANPLEDLQGHQITRRPEPEPGALEAIEGAVLSRRFAELWAVALATGCRPGELRTLEASRIDLARRIMTVDGKTGPRITAFPEAVQDLLAQLCEAHPVGPIFLNSRGKPWTKTALVHHMHSVKRRAGITGVVMYHARGDFASRAAKHNSLQVVARLLGHRDSGSTAMRHYVSIDEDMLRDAVDKTG
jgi:integrase